MPLYSAGEDVEALLGEIEELALAPELAEPAVIDALERLARAATEGSEAWCTAHRELSRRLVSDNPWRSSVLARAVVTRDPDDHLAWGLLALAQSVLGNFRLAVRSYRRAVALAPAEPAYLHNLGHMLDVIEERPAYALRFLARAHALAPRDLDIAAGYAHALGRAGDPGAAAAILGPRMRDRATREHHALYASLVERADVAIASIAPASPLFARRRIKLRRRTRS